MAKTPNEHPADINAEIDRELEIAKARWGTFELKCLEGIRGAHARVRRTNLRYALFLRLTGCLLAVRLPALRPDGWRYS
jgi:hypothetical protein